MRSISWIRFVGAAALVALATGAGASVAAAKPLPGRPTRPRSINLFASSGLLFQINRIQCGVQNDGQTCVAFAGSPVGGGGFWPKGTPDQYIFNSGLQIGVVVDTLAGFSWAGDTTGAYFFDARGDQTSGEGLTGWFNALNPADVASWPNGAVVRDANDSIYNPLLLGQATISQGDAWVRYWEGNPNLGPRSGPGQHPAGLLVDQRALAWNFPSGNEDIVYFVFTFYNVTARSSSGAYNNPTIPPEIQAEIGAVGDRFQDINEQKFRVAIPDGGYKLTSIYADFAMDADVAVFSQNYGTAFLPFNIGSIYTGTFLPEVGWQFPPDIFGPPFAAAPGFIGVKYLKSPEKSPGQQVGLTMFSMTTNGAPHRDPVGVGQLYRYMSGFLGASDDACSPFTDPAVARARHLCYLATVQSDSRFFQASGPFDLPPGQATSIVVAYIQAAPVNVPGLVIGGDLIPGVPFSGDSIFADTTKVRLIDRVAGWVTQKDNNGDQIIEQNEVTTVPRSLFNKALIAQTVFDNGFLLPNAPKAPGFYLVPGDNQVTVVWQKSATETVGDPFFAAASDVTSALYDPNFRQFDVEGYRIYRGRTSSNLDLIAQFDYAGTSFVDFTGAIDYGDLDGNGKVECAPELGLQADCPVTFDTVAPFLAGFETDLSGNVIQIPPGGRVELASGGTINLKADTAVTGLASGFPKLGNTGVPFAYVDRSVRNSFNYFYAVTAFDVNSVKSGPTSLESPRVAKAVTPRRGSGQEVGASISSPQLVGAKGEPLDPSAPLPALNAATGIFSGPMPPTDQFVASLAAFIPQVLAGGQVDVKIDSIVPGSSATPNVPSPVPALYYVTGAGPTGAAQVVIPLQFDCCDVDAPFTTRYVPVVNSDASKASVFGGDGTFSLYSSLSIQAPGTWRVTSWGRGSINGAPANSDFNGPRWWTGAANENTTDPNGVICAPASGGCVLADLSRNAGAISGVTIFHPQSYSTVPSAPQRDLEGVTSSVTRAADFRVVWGANGAIDTVFDETHLVPVPFSPKIRASWGILNDSSFVLTTQDTTTDANNNLLTWSDPFCVDPMPAVLRSGCPLAPSDSAAFLMNHARLSPIALKSSSFAGTSSLTATGNGFIFYLNGHFFLMQMAALPAAGTVWHARFFSGSITGAVGSYEFSAALRPPAVPGLRASFTFTGSTLNTAATNDSLLRNVHTVPDPYYVTDALEITANSKILKFVNVPARCLIRIYSLSGVLVQLLAIDDPGGSGEATWNLRNRNNQFVASGVYFYQVETPDGKTKVGRFTIVNFAP